MCFLLKFMAGVGAYLKEYHIRSKPFTFRRNSSVNLVAPPSLEVGIFFPPYLKVCVESGHCGRKHGAPPIRWHSWGGVRAVCLGGSLVLQSLSRQLEKNGTKRSALPPLAMPSGVTFDLNNAPWCYFWDVLGKQMPATSWTAVTPAIDGIQRN